MGRPIASKTRKQIRQTIGYHLGSILVSTCSADAGAATTITDTAGLAYGGTDSYKGAEIIMISGTSTNIGDRSRVTAFNSTSKALTISPGTTGVTKSGDGYELHENYLIDEIDNSINQTIVAATDDIFIDKETHNTVKEENIYEYDALSGFAALYEVGYEYDVKIDHQLHSCDSVWDELTDADVTATADTSNEKEGSACLKLVVAAGCGANDILATDDITSIDITDCDEVTLWVHSTTALDAGDVQVLLDDTAQCAGTPLESLDIPAVSANTWTSCVISLANPTSDSAIISVGLKMITDRAFTLRVDDIRAIKSTSRIYKRLSPDFWAIVPGTTDYLKLNQDGYATIGNNKRLRLRGYQIPAELSTDSATCEIDPDFVIARALALLLGSRTGVEAQAGFWMAMSEKKLSEASTSLAMNTRFV